MLQTMAGAANSGYQIPEQVWGGATGTSDSTFAEPGDSATPLMWALTQYVRLAVDISAGHPTCRRPLSQTGRAGGTPARAAACFWRYIPGRSGAATRGGCGRS